MKMKTIQTWQNSILPLIEYPKKLCIELLQYNLHRYKTFYLKH